MMELFKSFPCSWSLKFKQMTSICTHSRPRDATDPFTCIQESLKRPIYLSYYLACDDEFFIHRIQTVFSLMLFSLRFWYNLIGIIKLWFFFKSFRVHLYRLSLLRMKVVWSRFLEQNHKLNYFRSWMKRKRERFSAFLFFSCQFSANNSFAKTNMFFFCV